MISTINDSGNAEVESRTRASAQLPACPHCPHLLGGEGRLGTGAGSQDASLRCPAGGSTVLLAPSAWKPHLRLQLRGLGWCEVLGPLHQPTHVLLSLCCLPDNPTSHWCLGIDCDTEKCLVGYWAALSFHGDILSLCHNGSGAGTVDFLSLLNGLAKCATLIESHSQRNAAGMGSHLGAPSASLLGFDYLVNSGSTA